MKPHSVRDHLCHELNVPPTGPFDPYHELAFPLISRQRRSLIHASSLAVETTDLAAVKLQIQEIVKESLVRKDYDRGGLVNVGHPSQ